MHRVAERDRHRTSGRRPGRPSGSAAAHITAEKILDIAEAQFAERGFYGTSLRDIGNEIGMPNASLLYHFPSKGRIYGAVLDRIRLTLDDIYAEVTAMTGGDVARFEALFHKLYDWNFRRRDYAQIVMRELIDNAGRAERVRHWYLADSMRRLTEIIAAGQRSGAFRQCDPELFVNHMIGSVMYFFAALPTTAGMSGAKPRAHIRAYREQALGHLKLALLNDHT